MDSGIFKKMRVKVGSSARVFFSPAGYPMPSEFEWSYEGAVDFTHLFIESREQFEERFAEASECFRVDGLFWVSYPKSVGSEKYDINRDSLFALLLSKGYHPVTQVALDEKWSALRVKKNEPEIIYEIPKNVKKV